MYTVQFFIAGYSAPEGTDVEYCRSLKAVKAAVKAAHEEACRYGAGYEPTSAAIFYGKVPDVTDMYPDAMAETGPRGGVHISGCLTHHTKESKNDQDYPVLWH